MLSIGTFLEYFDLMLYVHMAVLLNELFFQSSNSLTASLNTALAFCSTYVLRPLGALIFGWIGDNIGRKVTVVVTTTMMSISCVVMATLPTYAEIGITASILVTICRMVQGMSSMGEVIGAEIYVTEITKPPVQYPAVSMITIFSSLGGFAALGVSSLAIKQNFNWRYAFWAGAGIALVGSIARTKLRETPDFANAKSRVKNIIKKAGFNHDSIESNPIVQEKVKIKSSISLFLIQCAWPVCFYFIYFHCSNILKSSFGYSGEQIVDHNFIISIVQVLSFIIWTYLSCYIYPLILLKVKLIIFSIIVLIFPYLLNNLNSPSDLLILQLVTIMFSLSYSSAMPIFYKHFPVFKRFTYASFLYALSRAFIYVITSFGLVYLTNYFGNYGILIVIVPTILGFAFGLNHFGNLEKEVGNYPQKDLN
ncbi:MFS transporter [Candidatus Tisiphia endosymbiont of Myopa tessellatipennis]|uniref:MFS transporter n=1 Tax=Candidatus Tisiphia endosymbiont of Myopa tessellatipennis TaxID=3066257 RepID=UPI00313D72B1